MMHETLRYLSRPSWIGLVLAATIAAAAAGLWMGLQRQPAHTATTFVFGRRVGYLDQPVPVLDDHIDDIVNAVEFPAVFLAIEERTLLLPDDDYEFTIDRLEDEESVVEVVVQAERAGDAERIARILVEEMVAFVLDGQEASIASQIEDLDQSIAALETTQAELRAQSFGIPPAIARDQIEFSLLNIDDDSTLDEDELRRYLSELQPLADSYRRTTFELNALYRDRAGRLAEQSDVVAAIESINAEWYRSISPVEPASNLPVAVAMAFAAGIPAVLVAALLVTLTLNRRLTGHLLPRSHPQPSAI